MIEHWRKINLDTYINNLHDFYKDCSTGRFKVPIAIDTLNQDEIKYLNSNIRLSENTGADKSLVLNKILKDSSKFHFARYLLVTLNIDLDVNNLDETNKSIFELLIDNELSSSEFFYHSSLISLYKRGYRNKKNDELFLIEAYKNKIKTQQALEIWCLARICFKLNDLLKIEKAFAKEKVLLALLSFKLGKPVGFNYPNLHGLANNAIQYYREYGDLILIAMKYYNIYDDVKKRDKKGTFNLKVQEFNKFKPIQDKDFNEIVFEIYPELQSAFI